MVRRNIIRFCDKIQKIKYRLLLIFFGVLVALFLCEFVLRMGSLFVKDEIHPMNIAKNRKIRILCLGDSFTFGSGANPEFSYPAQLQRMLNDKMPKKSFEVINLGSPGKNSSLLAQELPQIIKNYKPDIVLVMIGINDYCNLQGIGDDFYEYKFIKGGVFDKLKIAKLFQILKLNFKAHLAPALKDDFRQKIFAYFNLVIKAAQQRRFHNLEKAEMLSRKAIKEFPLLALGYLELARVYQDKKSFFRSLYVFKKVAGVVVSEEELPIFSGLIELSRRAEEAGRYDISIRSLALARCFSLDNEQVYAEFDHIFAETEDPKKAISVYKALNNIFPEDEQLILRLGRMFKAVCDFDESKKYWTILLTKKDFEAEASKEILNADFFIQQGLTVPFKDTKYDLLSEFLGGIAYLKKDNSKRQKNELVAKHQRILLKNGDRSEEEYLSPVFAQKIEFIADICCKSGVRLFFVSYPLFVQPYVLIEAKRRNIPFIDLRPRFLKELKEGKWNDFFVHDGHCTALGYEVIAKAVAAHILNSYHACIP